MANQIVWVDIPVLDLDRAIGFYSAVLGRPVKKQEYPGMTIGLLPDEDKDVSGCLVADGGLRPSDSGPLIYLNAQGTAGRGRRRGGIRRREDRAAEASDRPLRPSRDHPRQRGQPGRSPFDVSAGPRGPSEPSRRRR